MITEPTYIEPEEAAALCNEDSCYVHEQGDLQCPILVAESMIIESIRGSI